MAAPLLFSTTTNKTSHNLFPSSPSYSSRNRGTTLSSSILEEKKACQREGEECLREKVRIRKDQ
jgi:hypothetical protein